MCTGAEVAAAAAAAAETSAVGGGAGAALTGIGAGATGASAVGAGAAGSLGALGGSTAAALETGGLGSMLAGGGSAAASAGADAAGIAALESGVSGGATAAGTANGAVGSTAGATLSSAEAAPASLTAAESSVVPSSAAPLTGPAQGSVLPAGPQVSGADTFAVTPGGGTATPASNSFLGMTPQQWQQQLLLQGASAGLQAVGNMQSQQAMSEVSDDYNAELSDWQKQQIEAVDKGMSGFTPEAIAEARQNYSDEMMQAYDTSAAARPSFGTLLLDSTPDEVKADYAAKQAASAQYARDQFGKSVDLTSLGRAMTSGAQQLQDALTKASMNKGYINSLMGGLSGSLQQAAGSGALASGAGNLTSSLGNLMLASQQASGSKPASVLDIR